MTATRTLIAMVAFAILSVNSVTLDGQGASNAFADGDQWVYNEYMTMDTIVLSGELTRSYGGETTKIVVGDSYETYVMNYHGTMTASGTMSDVTVTGTATIDVVDWIVRADLREVMSDYNLSMTVSMTVLGNPLSYIYWEHNVTSYTPPTGVGGKPENTTEGASWTETGYMRSQVTVSDDGAVSNSSHLYAFSTTYAYLGVETVTVPAGTFTCDVIQYVDSDGTTKEWYSDEVGTYVKSQFTSGSSTATETLKSFDYTPPSAKGISDTVVIAGLGVGIVVAIVLVVSWVLVKRRRPQGGQPRDGQNLGPAPPQQPPGDRG